MRYLAEEMEACDETTMDDVLEATGVDPMTAVDRLPDRGLWALAAMFESMNDDD